MKNSNIVKVAALTLGTLVALLSFSGQALGQVPSDPFVILLKGIYEPVVHGPNLGLSQVNLSDGSYSTTTSTASAGFRVAGATRSETSTRGSISVSPLCVPTNSRGAR